MPDWTIKDIPSQLGRSAVVTGTGGIGFEDALALARARCEIIIAGRSLEKGSSAIARIRAAFPDAKVRFEELDLASLRSVKDFGSRMRAQRSSLDILINNAAVMTPPMRKVTSDGFELQLGTNYLGHFALTAELLPLLRNSREPRIINVSSVAARSGVIDFDDLQAEHLYRPMQVYSQSKLACLMFAFELQNRSEASGWKIKSIAAHPGVSRTELISADSWKSAWRRCEPRQRLTWLRDATCDHRERGGMKSVSVDQKNTHASSNPIAVICARLCFPPGSPSGGHASSSKSGMVARACARFRGVPSTAWAKGKSGHPASWPGLGRAAFAFGMCLVALDVSGAGAADGDVRASYAVSFASLPLAKATLYVSLRGNVYSARVDYRVSGAMRMLSDAAGVASSTGTYKGGRFVPTGFDLDHRSGSRRQKVKLSMADGAVKAMTVDPPTVLESNQTPIESKHLTSVVDPLSAFLVAAAKVEGRTQGGVCDRELSILDGLRRYDVKLEPQGNDTTVLKGLVGSTTVCRAIFQPVAGQIGEGDGARARSSKSDLDQIIVAFGRASLMDLYIPVSVHVQTQFGAASVSLTEFSADPVKSTASR